MSEVVGSMAEDGIRLTEAQRRQRRARSIAIAVALAVLVVVFYVLDHRQARTRGHRRGRYDQRSQPSAAARQA